MALTQDENSVDGGKSLVKRTHAIISKSCRKWTYNGIYMSPPKYVAEERSSCIEKPSKWKKNTESKCSYNGIHLQYSKYEEKEKSNSI